MSSLCKRHKTSYFRVNQSYLRECIVFVEYFGRINAKEQVGNTRIAESFTVEQEQNPRDGSRLRSPSSRIWIWKCRVRRNRESASLLSLYLSLPPPPSPPSLFLPFFVSSTVYIHHLSLCATLLRVPSFPREPLRCLLILPWIPTGGPDSSKVSTLKSWLWATVVSFSFFSLTPISPISFSRCWQDQPPPKIHSKQVRQIGRAHV